MPRQLQTERRHLHHAHRFTLFLALLITPGFVLIAGAAVPPPITFQGYLTSSDLCSPRGIGLSPSGDLFVGSDCGSAAHMTHYTASGGLVGTWGFPAGYQGAPNGVAVDGSGNVFVIDSQGNRVLKFTSSGVLVTTWGSFGSRPGQFSSPVDIAVDGAGNVFVVEIDGRRVQKFTNDGSYLMAFGGAVYLQGPAGIGLDASGRIYVADYSSMRVLRFQANGDLDMLFATPGAPYDVAVGPDGNVYVIYIEGSGGQQFSPSGALLQGFGSPDGLAGWPFRIAISPAGAIFVVEQDAVRIMKFQIGGSTSATRSTFGRVKALYR